MPSNRPASLDDVSREVLRALYEEKLREPDAFKRRPMEQIWDSAMSALESQGIEPNPEIAKMAMNRLSLEHCLNKHEWPGHPDLIEANEEGLRMLTILDAEKFARDERERSSVRDAQRWRIATMISLAGLIVAVIAFVMK